MPQGSLGRNALTGFGFSQVDIAVSREFPGEGARRFEIRAEAFNALNQGSYGDPVRYLNSSFFGAFNAALSAVLGIGNPHSGLAPNLQIGSQRSVQFTARLRF